jgi:hypothetical protein
MHLQQQLERRCRLLLHQDERDSAGKVSSQIYIAFETKNMEKKSVSFFDNIFQDILDFGSKPETHTFIEVHVIRPLMVRIFRQLYPYLIGVLILWVLMFTCLAVILLMLIRGSMIDMLLIRK